MELIIEEDYRKLECRIYAREQRGSQVVIIGYDGESLVEYTLGPELIPDIKPLLTIPIMMKENLLKAFTQEASKINLNTENENLLRGKLEATELHLKDMRDFSQKLLDNNQITLSEFMIHSKKINRYRKVSSNQPR